MNFEEAERRLDVHRARASEKPRWTLTERLETPEGGWTLSRALFGDVGADIYDFEMFNYVYLLDHATSREALVNGLRELSPLADDALDIAEQMTEGDFYDFKIALAHERGISARGDGESKMPDKYYALILPERLITAIGLAQKAEVPLGAAIIRMMEFEKKP